MKTAGSASDLVDCLEWKGDSYTIIRYHDFIGDLDGLLNFKSNSREITITSFLSEEEIKYEINYWIDEANDAIVIVYQEVTNPSVRLLYVKSPETKKLIKQFKYDETDKSLFWVLYDAGIIDYIKVDNTDILEPFSLSEESTTNITNSCIAPGNTNTSTSSRRSNHGQEREKAEDTFGSGEEETGTLREDFCGYGGTGV